MNENLALIIDLQEKAYTLLMWLQKSMDKGWFSSQDAHKNMTSSEATFDWVKKHVRNFPESCRPNVNDNSELELFSNLFSSFLTTSFEVVEDPGEVLYSEGGHCFCPWCSWMKKLSHLRPKSLSKKDKRRSRKMIADSLEQLCLNSDIAIEGGKIEEIINERSSREEAAMITYADELIKRSKGISSGPATLALWREFAWNDNGSPKKNFKLRLDMVIESERSIIHLLKLKNNI